MKFTNENEKFQWIGEGVLVQELKRASKTRYRAFSLGHLVIEIGDFVLVRNDDALDPEDCMSCFVAQVKDLLDTGNDLDPYQAQVQWFSRITELPSYAIKSLKCVGHDLEIVKDTRPSWYNMIDAETIFQKCEVLFLTPDADYESALLEYSNCPLPVFFCRYKFTGKSLTEVKEKPIGDTAHLVSQFVAKKDQNANGVVDHIYDKALDSATHEKGVSDIKAVEKYCAIQIGSPSKCPRVLIKKIDDRILDSSNGSVRIFVADSNVKKIEEVADMFLNKLKLQKQDEQSKNLEKKPIIHGLISSDNVPQKNVHAEDNEVMDYEFNVKTKTCNTPPSQKSSGKKKVLTPLSKSRKNLFSYKLRNSPKKSIKNLFYTSTRNEIPTLDSLRLRASHEEQTENFLSKAKEGNVSYLKSNKHENLEKKPLIHYFKSEKKLDSDATEEFLTSDSDIESRKTEPHDTRKSSSKKTATPTRNRASKRLNMNGDDLNSDAMEEFAVSDYEIESRKTETPETGKNSCSKKTVTSFRNRACKKLNMNDNNLDTDTTEELLKKDSEIETEMRGTPKTRKKNDTPSRNRACKQLNIDSVKKSPNKAIELATSGSYSTPKKRAKFADVIEDYCLTRSGRRVKSINYSESVSEIKGMTSITPSKTTLPRYVREECSADSDSSNFNSEKESSSDDDSSVSDVILLDETFHKKKKTVKSNKSKTHSRRSLKDSDVQVTPIRKAIKNLCIPERKTPLRTPKNALEESRQRLHVSSVPNSLPCRDDEYSDIYSFVKGCLCAQTGGCMYISGVPGTGKTATVHEVMRNLEDEKELGEIPIFTFVEVNGMWMTDPYQCYVQIFKALTGKTIAPQQAADLLEKRFTERGPKKDAVVLLVDELDRLWTRKQTVMYNIFDWPTKKNSKLIVLAIANTMDLPERMMINRISSRLGLTRKTFQPYTFKQLQEIIMSRIQELKVFDSDAVQLVARKVAAVSGDARRALDICRFATETVKVGSTAKKGQKVLVGMEQVDIALQQMFSSPVISAIRSSSKIAKLFFQCVLSEFTRTGVEETTLLKVHRQVVSLCKFEGLPSPNSTEFSRICGDLAASHLVLIDNFRNDLYMKIRLNVSSDDVTYALTLK